MDIGNLKNNTIFYEGYEGEPEIVLSASENKDYNIHLWEGYFDDIFSDPSLDGNGWKGFTRDIHQMEGIFNDDITSAKIDAQEYLEDLLTYTNRNFDYDESADALALLVEFLKFAIQNNYTVSAMKK